MLNLSTRTVHSLINRLEQECVLWNVVSFIIGKVTGLWLMMQETGW